MRQVLFLLSIVFLMQACDKEVEQGPSFVDTNQNDVDIQVENKSWFVLDSLYLNTNGGSRYYGDLGVKKTSGLKSFRFAYPEMEIRFQVNGVRFIHVPVDYSTMDKIENGQYELEINSVDTVNLLFTFLLEEI